MVGFIIKLTGKAKSDVEYEAEQKATIKTADVVEAPTKKEASTEVPF